MIREDVVLVADGGDLTVGRHTGVYTWGNFEVVIPEGREQETSDDRLQDGFISRPVVLPTGRFDIGFVRADATIDLEAQTSDLESVIDTAQKRSEGDVFFERDITGRGLGRYIPGVDFDIGDIVQVEVFTKRLFQPVTDVEMVVSTSQGATAYRVHVGGQLVSDPDTLRRHNDANVQALAAENRQRLKEAGEIRETATTAKSTADDALAAATDADGVIQGHVDAAAAASQAAHEASQASLGHSEAAGAHSDVAAGHSADASEASVAASGHSATAAGHADTAAGHSADASLASQAAAGHSDTAAGHSTDASLASQEARDASTTAAGHSGSAWDYSQLADQAALAAGGSEADAAEWKRLAEVARSLAEAERSAAETARADAEDARDAAEVSRSAAESGRADAEAARDRAEQARARSMASMAAAEMMRAQAEEARRLAEDARALAEESRADAEDARKDAEDARSLAEEHRNDAFGHMQEAFGYNEASTKSAIAASNAAQDAAEKALTAQMTGWAKLIHPGTPDLHKRDTKVGAGVAANGLSAEIGTGWNTFWAGEVLAKAYFSNNTVQTKYATAPLADVIRLGGGSTPITLVEVEYRDLMRVGKKQVDRLTTGWDLAQNNTWYQHKSGAPWLVTVPADTDVNAVFSVGWDAAGFGGAYMIQARVNGTPVKTIRNEGFGPQWPWQGGGYRTQLLNLTGADTLKLKAGDTLGFWVHRERTGTTTAPQERRIRDFELSVAWSEPDPG